MFIVADLVPGGGGGGGGVLYFFPHTKAQIQHLPLTPKIISGISSTPKKYLKF